MFNKLLGKFSKDMAVDLGTTNTIVYIKDKGIVINEPSVVAVNTRNDSILAVGEEARKMIGKTPPHIIASQPLSGGVISDFEVAEKMLKYFIDRVHQETFSIVPRPRLAIGIPLHVTEVERKAVEDVALSAGASEVILIEEPMAAAIGARLSVQEARASMVIDIGGGTTQVAVISLSGVVNSKSIKIAGESFNKAIVAFARDKYNLLLGDASAEEIKIRVGSAIQQQNILETSMRGRDLVSGLPREEIISDVHVREALMRTVRQIVETVTTVIEDTPPELVSEIYQNGITMTGGGSLLRGLNTLIEEETGVSVVVADDPLTAGVRGAGIVLEDQNNLRDVILPST